MQFSTVVFFTNVSNDEMCSFCGLALDDQECLRLHARFGLIEGDNVYIW